VLNNLSEQVGYCYRRAGECRELAEVATSPGDKAFYSERERNWLVLARSYDLQDSAGLFTRELRIWKRHRSGLGSNCPDCAAPTETCWSTILVCTNCRRVVENQ
jgi:hypothetical protein